MSKIDDLLRSTEEEGDLTDEKTKRIARAIAKLIFEDLQRENRLREWQKNRK